MRELEIFNYEGNNVTFKAENGETYINATQMAKPFGKKVNDWLRLSATKEFLQMLENQKEADLPISDNQLVIQKQGTPKYGGGTWMHEDAALEFARWLSPYFAKWTNDRIKELMKYGVIATSEALEKALTDPDNVIRVLQALKKERSEKELYKERTEFQQKTIEEQSPKAEYIDKVLQSKTVYSATQIAKEFGMSAVTLNKKLHDAGIQYKKGGRWILYAKYQDKGYTKLRTKTWEKDDGTVMTRSHMYWSEKGRAFLHSFLNKSVLIPSDVFP